MRYAVYLLAVLATVFLVSFSCADSLKLSISTPKAQYVVDEPLIVTLEVKNTGNSKAQIWRALLEPETSGVVYEVTDPDGKTYQWEPECRIDWAKTPREAITLYPGDRYSRTQDLSTQWGNKLKNFKSCLAQPGNYRIRVVGRSYEDSNVLDITVAEPEGYDKASHDILLKQLAIATQEGDSGRTRPCRLWGSDPCMRTVYESLCFNAMLQRHYLPYAQFYYAAVLERLASGWRAWDSKSRGFLGNARSYSSPDSGTGLRAQALLQKGRVCAKLRDFDAAQDALEMVLLSSSSTTEDKLTALRYMNLIEIIAEHSIKVYLEFTSVARAFGLEIRYTTPSPSVTLTGPQVNVELRANTDSCIINGCERKSGMREPYTGAYELDIATVVEILSKRHDTHAFDYVIADNTCEGVF